MALISGKLLIVFTFLSNRIVNHPVLSNCAAALLPSRNKTIKTDTYNKLHRQHRITIKPVEFLLRKISI